MLAGRRIGLCVTAVIVAIPTMVGSSVLCKGMLYNRGILGVLRHLAKVGGIRPIKIVIFDIDADAAVGGYICKIRILLFLALFFFRQGRCRYVIAEVEDLLDGLCRILGVFGIGRADNVEEEVLVVLQTKVIERKMLGLERILYFFRYLHSKALQVENLLARACSGVDDIIVNPFRCFP